MVYSELLARSKQIAIKYGHKLKYYTQTGVAKGKIKLQKGYGQTRYYFKKTTDYLFGIPRTKPAWIRVEYSGMRKKFRHRPIRMLLRPFLGWFSLFLSINGWGISTYYENPPIQPIKGVQNATPVPTISTQTLSGNGLAETSLGPSLPNGTTSNIMLDKFQRVVTVSECPRELVSIGTATISNTTDTVIISSGGAGVFLDLKSIVMTNTSATAVRVDFREGSQTTPKLSFGIAANGGAVFNPTTAVPQVNSNNSWNAVLSGSVTDIRIFMMACKNQ